MSYGLPNTLISRLGLRNLMVAVVGENLKLWTNAETAGDPTTMRSLTAGNIPDNRQRMESPSNHRVSLMFRGGW
jgi:hypothetical protein